MSRLADWRIRTRLVLAFLGMMIPLLMLAGVAGWGIAALWESIEHTHTEALVEAQGGRESP